MPTTMSHIAGRRCWTEERSFVHRGKAGALEERPTTEDAQDGDDVEEAEHARLFAEQQPSLLEEEDEFEEEEKAHVAAVASSSTIA
eukprot:2114796-Amphidinium_carterae.1